MARLVPVGLPEHVLRRRAFGVLKGKLKLPDSFFFDPLPEEELKTLGRVWRLMGALLDTHALIWWSP